ncbi:MAG: hypothetical protein ACK6EB_04490, partial [Planctomyces sp.]
PQVCPTFSPRCSHIHCQLRLPLKRRVFFSDIPPVMPSETSGKLRRKLCLEVSFQFFVSDS